jgi:hypothetical protein
MKSSKMFILKLIFAAVAVTFGTGRLWKKGYTDVTTTVLTKDLEFAHTDSTPPNAS